jgi:hypothetical protein
MLHGHRCRWHETDLGHGVRSKPRACPVEHSVKRGTCLRAEQDLHCGQVGIRNYRDGVTSWHSGNDATQRCASWTFGVRDRSRDPAIRAVQGWKPHTPTVDALPRNYTDRTRGAHIADCARPMGMAAQRISVRCAADIFVDGFKLVPRPVVGPVDTRSYWRARIRW